MLREFFGLNLGGNRTGGDHGLGMWTRPLPAEYNTCAKVRQQPFLRFPLTKPSIPASVFGVK
jgi:hypothetical protein